MTVPVGAVAAAPALHQVVPILAGKKQRGLYHSIKIFQQFLASAAQPQLGPECFLKGCEMEPHCD